MFGFRRSSESPLLRFERFDPDAGDWRTGNELLDNFLAAPNRHGTALYEIAEMTTQDFLDLEPMLEDILALPSETLGQSLYCAILLNAKTEWQMENVEQKSNLETRLRMLERSVCDRNLGALSEADAIILLQRFAHEVSRNLELTVSFIKRSSPDGPSIKLHRALAKFAEYRPDDEGIVSIRYRELLTDIETYIGRDPDCNPNLVKARDVIEEANRRLDDLYNVVGPFYRDILDDIRIDPSREALSALQEKYCTRMDSFDPVQRAEFALDNAHIWALTHRDSFWLDVPPTLTEHGLPFHPGWTDRCHSSPERFDEFRRRIDFSSGQAIKFLEYILTEPPDCPSRPWQIWGTSGSFDMSIPLAKTLARALPGYRWDSVEKRNELIRKIGDKPWGARVNTLLCDAIAKVEKRVNKDSDQTARSQAEIARSRRRILEVMDAFPDLWVLLDPFAKTSGAKHAEWCDWSFLNQQVGPFLPEIERYVTVIARATFNGLDTKASRDDVASLVERASQNLTRLEEGDGIPITQHRADSLYQAFADFDPSVFRYFPNGDFVFRTNAPEITRVDVILSEREALEAIQRQMAIIDRVVSDPDVFGFEWEMAPAENVNRPSAKWIKGLKAQLSSERQHQILNRIADYRVRYAPFDHHLQRAGKPQRPEREEQRMIRGLVWAAHLCPPEEAGPIIVDLVMDCFVTVPNVGIKAEKLGNAGLWCLEALPDGLGAPYLARILARTKYPKVRKKIDAALNRAAEAAGMTRTELDELTVPDHQLNDGVRRVELIDGAAILRVHGSRVQLTWEDSKGTARKAPPKAVKDADPDGIKAIRRSLKEIEKDLSAQTARIQSLYLKKIDWDYQTWRQRYADHGTMATPTRRLLWRADFGGHDEVIRPTANGCEDVSGQPVECAGARITLWHPLDSADQDVLAWRQRLIELEIQQPFKQAWRETYKLTDAERQTETYSNRFAGHIVKQHQMMSLAHINGWRCTHRMWVDAPNDEPSHIQLPDFDLYVEFWTEGAGDDDPPVLDSGAYIYLATDRIKFCRLDPEARFGRGGEIGLEDVPQRVFSEIMRHCDLFTSVASISLDPEWIDRGVGAEHPNQWRVNVADAYWHSSLRADLMPSGEIHKQVLAGILPRLANADAFSLEKNHLRVRGVKNEYLVHLGSAAVLMQPTDRHICIVRGRTTTGKVFLPFEGDQMLSLILSKALLLARDDKITDPVILGQIRI